MNKQLENELRNNPSPLITQGELAHLLKKGANSRHSQLSRAAKKGELIRVKRGLYCLSEHLAKRTPHPFELASFIYGPSYISLESALSYHGLIPESVPSITSTSIKRNTTAQTPFGFYTYHRLPTFNFFIGVEHVKEDDNQFLLATPWKALLDYIYCYKKNWQDLSPVVDSLRIEPDDLPSLTRDNLLALNSFYQSQRIHRFIKHIPRTFIREH
jgi:predicted transcriptional regulator of viral defense system